MPIVTAMMPRLRELKIEATCPGIAVMRAAARFALCEIHLAVKVLLPMKLVIRGFLAVNLVRSVRVGPSSQVGGSPIRALLDFRARLGPARLWFRHQGERVMRFGFGRDLPAADRKPQHRLQR